MKTNNFIFKSLVVILLTLLPKLVHADASDGFGQIFNLFFGTESSRQNSKTCDGGMSDGGVLSIVNGFFCHMEKDMGITGTTSGVTKTFQDMKVRAVVEGSSGGGAYTVDSVAYDYRAQVWVCLTSSSSCAATTNFNRAVYITYSYKSDNTINKGHMFMNPGAFSGQSSAMNLKYDLGTSTATKTSTLKMKHTAGGQTFSMHGTATKTSAGIVKVNMVAHNGTFAFRFVGTLDETNNMAAVYFETPNSAFCSGTGCATVNTAMTGDTLSVSSNGLCTSRSRTSTDWAYTAVANSNCSSLSFAAFPPVSATDAGNYSTTATDGTGILVPAANGSLYNGMTANPSAIE